MDTSFRNKLDALANPPQGGTNYIFWIGLENPEEWGLTIKQMTNNGYKKTSQAQTLIWKVTW